MADDAKPRRRRAPMGGKGHHLSARITEEMREALTSESERSGRSVSQVAEAWMEEARRGRASAEDQLGGGDVAPALRAMAAAAREIESIYGVPSVEWEAHAAILGAWNAIARALVPTPGPDAEELKLLSEVRETKSEEAANRIGKLRHDRQVSLGETSSDVAKAYSSWLNGPQLAPMPFEEVEKMARELIHGQQE